jgi:hypothetical protein
MYLTLLDEYTWLISDTSLYNDSLNIWVNVLPKYATVGYINEYDNLMKLTSMKNINKNDIKRFVATKTQTIYK